MTVPDPDPGNSQPENWTEPLDDKHINEVLTLLSVGGEDDGGRGTGDPRGNDGMEESGRK